MSKLELCKLLGMGDRILSSRSTFRLTSMWHADTDFRKRNARTRRKTSRPQGIYFRTPFEYPVLAVFHLRRAPFSLISDIVLLDQPIYGMDILDSFFLIDYLRQWAARGRIVIMTIHPPTYEIFTMMSRGECRIRPSVETNLCLWICPN